MTEELMISAICWELQGNVSVEFAHENDLYFFCPDQRCLAEVIPAKKKNYFFRAPQSHASGCQNEKKKTESGSLSGVRKQFAADEPVSVVPSHLGKLPKQDKKSRPSVEQMRTLAIQVRTSPIQHPGTLEEVIDAWHRMSINKRHSTSLDIGGQALNYFSAFAAFSALTDDVDKLTTGLHIAFGDAKVNLFKGDYYVKSLCKFKDHTPAKPLIFRVRQGHSLFNELKDGQTVSLFVRGPVSIRSAERNSVDLQCRDAYSGIVVRPKN